MLFNTVSLKQNPMSKQIKKEKKGQIYFIKESNHFNTLSINPTKWSNTLKVPQKGPKKILNRGLKWIE